MVFEAADVYTAVTFTADWLRYGLDEKYLGQSLTAYLYLELMERELQRFRIATRDILNIIDDMSKYTTMSKRECAYGLKYLFLYGLISFQRKDKDVIVIYPLSRYEMCTAFRYAKNRDYKWSIKELIKRIPDNEEVYSIEEAERCNIV